MKPLLISLTILLSFSFVSPQTLKKGTSQPIVVNYDKTVHLIFPERVKYSKSVDDFVVIDNPEEAPHIVRVKANSKDFTRTTTISIATEEGKFYSFVASYADSLPNTTYRIGEEASPIESIDVNEISDVHLVAPDRIVYIDYGNENIIGGLAEATENILRVKAKHHFQGVTNLSFALSDGRFYSYDIKYTPTLDAVLYTLDNLQSSKVILTDTKVSKEDKSTLLSKVLKRGRDYYSLGLRKSGITFSVQNIYSQKDILILVLELDNTSSIPYDIHYTRYSIISKKSKRHTAQQELEQIPTLLSEQSNRIEAKRSLKLVISFPKFTISEDSFFHIDIVEKNGGRNISYDIDAKSIIDAKIL